MKLVGHAATAIIVASPLIYLRGRLPFFDAPGLSDFQLLWWSAIWATVPDIDIILSRFTPIKHRGYLSHSLLTVALCGLFLVGLTVAVAVYPQELPQSPDWLPRVYAFCNPLTALLGTLGVMVHLLGDSLTKTGVPLLRPNRPWHFPGIGGHVAFDNYFLNLLPVLLALYIMHEFFGLDLRGLYRFTKWEIPQ